MIYGDEAQQNPSAARWRSKLIPKIPVHTLLHVKVATSLKEEEAQLGQKDTLM